MFPWLLLDNMCGTVHSVNVTQYRVLKTAEFLAWRDSVPPKTRALVDARLDLLAVGHLGFFRRFEGLLELKWKNGTRVYAFFWRHSIVVALYGGDKHGQDRNIRKAKRIREEVVGGTRTVFES